MVQPQKSRNGSGEPVITPDWVKESKVLRFDRDIVEQFGLKAARFVTHLECWLHGKVKREPDFIQYTYDPAWVICERTGLKPATLERVIKKLCTAKFIKIKHGRKSTRHYALRDQHAYFDSRAKEKHVFALRADADQHGEAVAILLFNLRHWIKQNKQERHRLFHGRYWRHDTVKSLVGEFTGFLTMEQLRDSLHYMHDRQLVDLIGFYDANGVRQDGRFWITLMERPPVDDYEPQNLVRPASFFTPNGVRIIAGKDAEKSRTGDDKTASPNDKTHLGNDKTGLGQNNYQPDHPVGVTGNGDSPLNDNHLIAPPEFAGATSVSAQERISDSLPPSDASARPSASRKPPASSADRPTAGDSGAYSLRRVEELEDNVEKLTRQIQQMNLSSGLKKTPVMNRDGWLESQVDMLLRIPRSDRRNLMHQFTLDLEAARKEQNERSSPVDQCRLAEEFRQLNMKRIPRECFSYHYGDPLMSCKHCVWKKSCEIATPIETREAIQNVSVLNTPDWNVLRESDRPENVVGTYRACYREVFGKDAPDVVGKADAIYRNAQSLKLPVRYYCLIYMSLWANTHLRQTFYARFLSGENAFETVTMVFKLCDQKYGAVLEDRLAMVLNLKFAADKKPLWRHQPTPTERFMEGWLAACTDRGQPDYQFQKQEVRELIGLTDDMRVREAADLLDKAKVWLIETTGEKTLMRFLCEIQGKPLPEPEIDPWPVDKPYYERYIDEDEGVFDVKRTRAYWEEGERAMEALRQSRPDSGKIFLEQALIKLQKVDAPKRGGSKA